MATARAPVLPRAVFDHVSRILMLVSMPTVNTQANVYSALNARRDLIDIRTFPLAVTTWLETALPAAVQSGQDERATPLAAVAGLATAIEAAPFTLGDEKAPAWTNIELAYRVYRIVVALLPTVSVVPVAMKAQLLHKIGMLAPSRVLGRRGRNLARSKNWLEEAVALMDRKRDKMEWAAAQANLGQAWVYLCRYIGTADVPLRTAVSGASSNDDDDDDVVSDQADSQPVLADVEHAADQQRAAAVEKERMKALENAVECFHNALQVFQPSGQAAELWALCHQHLGELYTTHIVPNPRAAVDSAQFFARFSQDGKTTRDKAIYHLRQAARVLTKASHAARYAELCKLQGDAASSRFRLSSEPDANDQAEREAAIDESLMYYNEVLDSVSMQSDPMLWGNTHNSMGIVYGERSNGTDKDNVDSAKMHFEHAMQVFTKERAPDTHAMLQRNINLLTGDGKQHSARRSAVIPARKDGVWPTMVTVAQQWIEMCCGKRRKPISSKKYD